MTKTGKSFKKFLSLALCTVLSLGVFLNLAETKFLAEELNGTRSGETYVHEDDFDTYTEDDAKHYNFFGRENGKFSIDDFKINTITDNGVTLDPNGAAVLADAYKSAVLINANPTVNQYVRIDFTKESINPMVWVRANKETVVTTETVDGVETTTEKEYITGYFVYWSSDAYFRLYKAEIVNGKYTLTQLARCDQFGKPGGDQWSLSIEVSAVGTNPTVLNVKTYKNDTSASNLDQARDVYGVQTITDNTASLQKSGTPAMSTFQPGTGSAQIIKFSYHSDDGAKPNTYVLQNSAKGDGTLAGTVLAVETKKTYEFSYIADTNVTKNDSENDPVFIKYVSETASSDYSVLGDMKNFTLNRTEENGYNKFSGRFSLNTTDYTDLFYSYRFIASYEADEDKINKATVPIVVGINLNNSGTDEFRYKEFAVREVITDSEGNETYGPNLIVNGNFTLGAFNWSSQLKVKVSNTDTTTGVLGAISGFRLFDSSDSRSAPPHGRRILAMQETNNFDYHYRFLYDPDTALWGDANADDVIDVRDLVRMEEMSAELADYSVFADLSSYNATLEDGTTDGEITDTDLTELRSILLNGSKKISSFAW